MGHILKALLPSSSVRHLSIGKNFGRLKYSNECHTSLCLTQCTLIRNPSEVLGTLVTLVNNDSAKLESLSLADSKLRDHTVIVLDGLGINHCVMELDIR